MTTTAKLPAGPSGGLRNLGRIRNNTLGFLLRCFNEYGDISYFKVYRFPLCLASHPDYVKYVLQDNNRNYVKQTIGWKRMRDVLGNGLLTSEGDFWLRQRRMSQPLFHRRKIDSFAQIMTKAASEMIERWQQYAQRQTPFNVIEEMMRVSLQIVGDALLGTDITNDASKVGHALDEILTQANTRMTGLKIPLFIPTRLNRRFVKALDDLNQVVYAMIEDKRKNGGDGDDLLSKLIAVEDEETGETMSDEQLRDEVMSIFLAGHETTANALTWTWFMLSKHPEVRDQLRQEVVQNLADRVPTVEDMRQLPYVDMVLKEVMRLFPPAWTTARLAVTEDTIGGYRIPAGTMVMMSQYIVHRHPRYWDNPEGFDPQRFAPENTEKIPRYAYFPFGGGPHLCIGNNFALLSSQLIMTMVMQRYRIDLLPSYPIRVEPSITLRPKYPMYVRIREY